MTAPSAAQTLITAMITPALLILASASLIATALVRLALVVDRVRKIGDAPGVSDAELERSERRAAAALLAIMLLFTAVARFVLSGVAIAVDRASGDRLVWLPVGLAIIGMS